MTDEDITIVLRPRSRKQQNEYTPRRTVPPRRPMTTRSRKPEMQIEDNMEASQSTDFGVKDGIYGAMKNDTRDDSTDSDHYSRTFQRYEKKSRSQCKHKFTEDIWKYQ
jgi:hypothetical protein